MKRAFIVAAIAAFVSVLPAFAVDAMFSEVNGKVEYLAPGGEWCPARVGDSIGKGALVSTGFKSTAVLKLGATSVTLKPLTRMSLEDLLKTEGGTRTKLYLLSGRVKADVPPQAGQKTEFSVKSPTATASVRGTSFEFDGMNLIVDRGTVQLQSEGGQYRYVRMGEFSYVNTSGAPVVPVAVETGNGLQQIGALVEQADAADISSQADVAPIGSVAVPAPLSTTLQITIN